MRLLLLNISLALLISLSEQQLQLRRDEQQEEGSGDAPRRPLLPRQPVVDTESSGDLPRTASHRVPDDGDFEIGSGELPTLKTMRTVVHNVTLATLIPDATTSRGSMSSIAPPSVAASSATSVAHRRMQSATDTIDIDSSPSVTQGVLHASSSARSQPPAAHARSTAATDGGARQPQSTSHRHMNNAVPTQPADDRQPVDEEKEEDSNAIGNAGYAVAESRVGFGPAHGGLHPGLLAAVIGGGVVGLLCAILLVMFVVYRLRKRDEGGYTTVDSKPRLNTYTKASSREFYA